MGIWSVRAAALVVALVMVFGLLATGTVQAQDENAVKDSFRAGIAAFDAGKFADAYTAFETALRGNPSSDLMLYLRDEAGDARLHDMMAQGGDLAQSAMRIMEAAKGAYDRVRRSPEEIAAYVKLLENPAFDERWTGILKLCQVGQLACPPLIDLLKDQTSDDLRTNVIVALTRLADDAVLPLIETLDSSNAFQRQNAAIVLGNIKDWRAAAGLKRVVEDANSAPEVKKYASEALWKITGQGEGEWPSAKDLYFQLAEKFYLSHPSVMHKYYQDYFVWKWNAKDDKLGYTEVPSFQLNERLAQEACFDALALDAAYEPAWPLLACTYLAEQAEGEIALKSLDEQVKAGTATKEQLDRLQADLKDLARAGLFGPLVGKQNLYKAVERSMADDRPIVAAAAIAALKASGEGEELPHPLAGDATQPPANPEDTTQFGYPLVRALLHEDKRVRYAAAEALVKMNPKVPFMGSNRVVPVLAEALSEMRVRTILIVDPDAEIRNRLKDQVTKLGYFPIEAATAQEGIAKAKAFPAEDVIVIDFKTAGHVVFTATAVNLKVTETVFDTLKQDERTKGIAIMILADTAEVESAKGIFKEGAVGYLAKSPTYLTTAEDQQALKTAMETLFSTPEHQADSKAAAEDLVIKAANALANLDTNNPVFDRVEAVEALVGNTSNRPDNIKLAALAALAKIGDPAAIEPLAKVFENAENAKPVRVAAGFTLAAIYKMSHAVANDAVFQVLKAQLMSDDIDISGAAAAALGNAALTSEQSRDVVVARRY